MFWLYAFDLLIPETHVSNVTFEAKKPKAFDDVVVQFDTPLPRGGDQRIIAECFQIKWHVDAGGRFGYEDLADPSFISAERVSLLERLKDAVAQESDNAEFIFVTTDRIADDDPLSELISNNDHSILLDRLFRTKTDKSRMGRVRAAWRQCLGLLDDQELKPLLSRLRIVDGYRSLEELRREVNTKAAAVGLKPIDDSNSDFRYDDLATKLKARGISSFTKERLEAIAKEEGIWVERSTDSGSLMSIAIHSFLGLATDLIPTEPENTLYLTSLFRQRYLNENRNWQTDIKPTVESFLTKMVSRSRELRLVMNAHASIAYLAGTVYHVKSGVHVEIVQKGIVGGVRVWRVDDGTRGSGLKITTEQLDASPDIAVGISITHLVDKHMHLYIDESLPHIGHLMSAVPATGSGHHSVAGGMHAAELAQQVAQAIREYKIDHPNATVHVFSASPNSFLFYLGQQHQGIGPVVVYEFDFDGRGNRGYQPSFTID
ncbi:MAG: SAVED domain-containing protein [Candidatus Thiodiazotropha endolucinida]